MNRKNHRITTVVFLLKKGAGNMPDIRLGRQTPTQSFILPYEKTHGTEAIGLYNTSGKTAMEWQELIVYDLLAYNDEGLFVHTKFGYSIPRRNGKNEIVSIIELWGILNGKKILHTAHRTTTSSSASKRLARLLDDLGYEEVQRVKKGEVYLRHYTYSKQFGLEKITILGDNGGVCDFRTRTATGGLGEGFDILIIDEAQEYTEEQETSLKYVVSDSDNPLVILCGTPPTEVSKGTVFPNLRETVLAGRGVDCGWAEWGVEEEHDPEDIDAWYEANPSMGVVLTERKVRAEISGNSLDFNIQRLGFWVRYNLESAIRETDWEQLTIKAKPSFTSKMYVGIKYGKDGKYVSLAIAVKTNDKKVYIEAYDCRPLREGNAWVLNFIHSASIGAIVVDGQSGQSVLESEMQPSDKKKLIKPKVAEIIEANAQFEKAIFQKTMLHNNQPSLTYSVTNCEKRAIGSNGGFGYKTMVVGAESSLIDAVALAHWAAVTAKEPKKQKICY